MHGEQQRLALPGADHPRTGGEHVPTVAPDRRSRPDFLKVRQRPADPHRAWHRRSQRPLAGGRPAQAVRFRHQQHSAARLPITAHTFNDHPVPRDAQPLPHPPPGTPRVEPRTARIRIRIDGAWHNGHIQRWSRLGDGTWAVWLSYQVDPDYPTIAPAWGWFVYDPEAIVPASTSHPQ